MVRIKHLQGCSAEVYEIIGRYAMDHNVILMRENLPIITKETYTWHVLMEGQKVKAFVGEEQILSYTKLQSFVPLNATKKELRWFIRQVVKRWQKTQNPKLTIAVRHEYVDIFVNEQFEIVKRKKNWTDLAFFQYEKVQQAT
ncbi:hypothetical protein [Chitinophaga tropicalis]|uniref:Uncharacterized protein n=1 Tax=Chitinophaga tropicalis TaxID=2683588 RepID=A0A7K1U027_9BACT|nr:hypothetical protein [Chitinophaga tropicalis]MVT07718.1 hypothetical protein [Chitinophaga tropicalis]